MSHFSGVNFEDLNSGVFIGKGELDFSIQSARSHESGVQDIRSIGGADDLDIVVGGKTELGKKYPSKWLRS
jgi:hypothetical protein